MGVLLSGASYIYIYIDNKSQVTNFSKPVSVLKKKCNSICSHAVCESVEMGESRITYIKTGDNLSDLLTKVLDGSKCRKLVSRIMYYDINDNFPQQ